MPFDISKFVHIRPFLFHITDSENLDRIAESKQLLSANRLKGISTGNVEHRLSAQKLDIDGHAVWLQTQNKLHMGHIVQDQSFTFSDLINLLNSKVFFWPGVNSEKPIGYGVRHRSKNAWPSGKTVTIRVRTDAVVSLAQFARCNSGSPRTSNRMKCVRNLQTFCNPDHFPGTTKDVVEVVFEQSLKLPPDTSFSLADANQWRVL